MTLLLDARSPVPSVISSRVLRVSRRRWVILLRYPVAGAAAQAVDTRANFALRAQCSPPTHPFTSTFPRKHKKKKKVVWQLSTHKRIAAPEVFRGWN